MASRSPTVVAPGFFQVDGRASDGHTGLEEGRVVRRPGADNGQPEFSLHRRRNLGDGGKELDVLVRFQRLAPGVEFVVTRRGLASLRKIPWLDDVFQLGVGDATVEDLEGVVGSHRFQGRSASHQQDRGFFAVVGVAHCAAEKVGVIE